VIVVLFALFWLLLVRPQRRRTAEQTQLIDSLEVGDEIVSAGGLYGVIEEIDGEELHVQIADGLVVRMARNAVVGIVEEDEEPAEAEPLREQDEREGTPLEDGPA
jgi:preprotein translocase subunit YajC